MAKPKRAAEVMKKFDYYAKQYGQGKLSMARAARDAGVSIWEMHSYVREHKITAQYDHEEFEHDLKSINARLRLNRLQVW